MTILTTILLAQYLRLWNQNQHWKIFRKRKGKAARKLYKNAHLPRRMYLRSVLINTFTKVWIKTTNPARKAGTYLRMDAKQQNQRTKLCKNRASRERIIQEICSVSTEIPTNLTTPPRSLNSEPTTPLGSQLPAWMPQTKIHLSNTNIPLTPVTNSHTERTENILEVIQEQNIANQDSKLKREGNCDSSPNQPHMPF